MVRTARALLLALCLAMASGCMVLDEVDAAAAKMPVRKDAKAAETAEAPSSASSVSAQSQAVLENTKRWWKEATSLAPADMDSGIARCRIDGGVQFMSRDDCRTRGGRPESPSG
jgi:hypothetical protein